jgi:hypothetical protein
VVGRSWGWRLTWRAGSGDVGCLGESVQADGEVRNVAITAVPIPARIWDRSSAKTPRIQCRRFSMLQCPRIASAMWSARTIQAIITRSALEDFACRSPGLPVFFGARGMGLTLVRRRAKRWASHCWLVAGAWASAGASSRCRWGNHEVASRESK